MATCTKTFLGCLMLATTISVAACADELAELVVEATTDANPSTPAALLRAANNLSQVGRPEKAKAFLEKLVALGLNDTALAELHAEFGSAFFISLARRDDLSPFAEQVAFSILDAATRVAQDPNRLHSLIAELPNADSDHRARIQSELVEAGEVAAAELLGSLADADQSAAHPSWRRVVRDIGRAATRPMVGG